METLREGINLPPWEQYMSLDHADMLTFVKLMEFQHQTMNIAFHISEWSFCGKNETKIW